MESSKPKKKRRKVGCLVVILILGGIFLVLAILSRGPEVPRRAALVLEVTGDLPSRERPIFEEILLGPGNPSVPRLYEGLFQAAQDERIKLVLLKLSGSSISLSQANELRELLSYVREKGKKVAVYSNDFSLSEYLAACAAHQIWLNPAGALRLTGLSLHVFLFKDLLKKLGISVRLFREGSYKTAFETFTQDELSQESREAISDFLQSVWDELVDWICVARKLKKKEVESIIDKGPLPAKQALSSGLVDATAWEEDLLRLCRKLGGAELQLFTWKDWQRSSGRPKGEAIAYFPLEGAIIGGKEGPTNLNAADKVAMQLERLSTQPDIKAVILRVDSPGGDAYASARLYHAVRNLSKRKHVVVSMGDSAASGGYYLACAGDTVLAHPFTITGSIGVFGGKIEVLEGLGKLGVKTEYFSKGKYAGVYDPLAPPVEGEEEVFLREIRWTYERFIGDVALARNLRTREVRKVAEGRIWSGKQALEKKLVDGIGGIVKAVEKAKALAGIKGPVRLEIWPKKTSLDETIFGAEPLWGRSFLERLFQSRVFALSPFLVFSN